MEKKTLIKQVNLKDEIAHFYQHLVTKDLIPKAQHIILHSGRGTTKSTFFSMYDLIRLMYFPHADIMVVGYEYEKMLQTVYGDYKFAAEVLQIPKQHIEFYSTKNGETYIKVKNKWGGVNKIWFEHGKRNSEGFKGLRPEKGNKWLAVRFYELTNFINWNPTELENICATFNRNSYKTILWDKVEDYCKNNGIEFKKSANWLYKQSWYQKDSMDKKSFETHEFCFEYEFNTPSSTQSGGGWVLDWLSSARKKSNVHYQFNNYLDYYEWEKFKFLGSDTLVEIENLKLTRPHDYNHIWLGEAAYDSDRVYPMLDRKIHFGKHENFKPDILVIGVDVGKSDPTVLTLNGFEYKQKDLRIQLGMHRWSHSNRKKQYIKDGIPHPYKSWDINQYANMILEFCEMVHFEYPWARIYFQMDREGCGSDFYESAFRYKNPLYLDINRMWKKCRPGQRTNGFQTALSIPGIVKISDPVLFSAFETMIYDPKKRDEEGERKRLDDPSNPLTDMDSLDSCEYGVLPWFWDIIIERVLKSKGKYEAPKITIF